MLADVMLRLICQIQLNQKASSNIPNPYEGLWDVVELAFKLKPTLTA
jgi:hypothetical protein